MNLDKEFWTLLYRLDMYMWKINHIVLSQLKEKLNIDRVMEPGNLFSIMIYQSHGIRFYSSIIDRVMEPDNLFSIMRFTTDTFPWQLSDTVMCFFLFKKMRESPAEI